MALTPVIRVSGTCVPVPGSDMDTDRIIPSRFLKCITFDELAGTMFWDERFEADGSSKGHPIDDHRFAGASIMIGGINFGCGSSREHAPQAIKRSGINAIVAGSFAEIFFGNSTGIGLPCVCASPDDLDKLNKAVQANPSLVATLDLEAMALAWDGDSIPVSMPQEPREALVAGRWDAVAGLLENAPLIAKKAAELPRPAAQH